MTIHSLWTEAVRRFAELPALGWVDGESWTYGEVDRRIRQLQNKFLEWGLAPGDRIALWAPNHPGWGVTYLATTTGPWVIVPILPDFLAADTANVLTHGEARVLIVGRGLLEVWNKWWSEAPEEKRIPLNGLRVEVLEDLIEVPVSAEVPSLNLPLPGPSDLTALIYTSGTTGASKGVMLTQDNISSNACTASPIVGFVPGDKMLSILPLAHTYECTLGLLVPLNEGAHVNYLNKPASPTVLLPALASLRPHAILSVPLFMEKIYRSKVKPGLNHGPVKFLSKIPGIGGLLLKVAGSKLKKTFGGRIKFFGVGGAPLAPEVAQFLQKSGFPYAIGYGLTETSPLVAGHIGGNLFSTGRILKGVEVKIAEPKNDQGAGEILVKGPNVMAGYYKDPVKTAEVFTQDGWFKTGDLGLFDKQGHLYIKGRSKSLILGPSGENIYPEAIEALINQDRLVLESLVLQRGHDIVAKVVLNDELIKEESVKVESHLAELKHLINEQLARYSRLSLLEVQPQPFEKTATLKVKRYLYR